MKNRNLLKITSLIITAAILAGTVDMSVSAANASASKEETVYVFADADGVKEKVVVSDWLKNPTGEKSITDKTELEDVTNIKGEESYSVNEDKTGVWAANGNDIYYQGTTQKELPVDMGVTYELDGKKISAEDLAGKSGKVKIRFDYKNKQKQTIETDGVKESVYVPFVVVTGMILDNDRFSNVEVSNGKIVNDGERTIVMGFALPGLQDNLQLEKETATVPDYVEVTAEAKEFALTTTLTVAANDVFHELDTENMDSLDGFSESIEELKDASTQLMDGSSALYNGLSELLDKSGELVAGIDKLQSGASQLQQGADTLKSGAGTLDSGIGELNSGLRTLSSNNKSLTAGAKQVFESLLSMADGQLKQAGLNAPKLTIENYKETLTGVAASLDKDAVMTMAQNTAKEKVTEAINAQREEIRAQMEAALQSPVSDEVLQGKIDEMIEAQMQSDEVQAQIAEAVQKAGEGEGSIQGLIVQLDSYNEFYQGVISYTQGVSDAYTGSEQLKAGSAQLKEGAGTLAGGAATLAGGIGSLKEGSGALIGGVTKLKDGAMQLSDGMKEFNEKGVQKIADALDGDLNGLVTRLQATADAAKAYKSFAGIPDGMDGNVKFIYRTESIGE